MTSANHIKGPGLAISANHEINRREPSETSNAPRNPFEPNVEAHKSLRILGTTVHNQRERVEIDVQRPLHRFGNQPDNTR